MSRTYKFKRVQSMPVSVSEAWKFFCTPDNLPRITPPGMGFDIISAVHVGEMYAGQLIEYKVKPVLGIPLYWMTEITHVKHEAFFVDEQRFGPYRFWHHQHHFKRIENGTEMTDIVHYRLPLGFLGNFANTLFVVKKLKEIFDYREKMIKDIF